MCGTKARRAYNAAGDALQVCARCDGAWPESAEAPPPMPSKEEFEEWSEPSGHIQRRVAPRRRSGEITVSLPVPRLIKLIAWLAAGSLVVYLLGYAIYTGIKLSDDVVSEELAIVLVALLRRG